MNWETLPWVEVAVAAPVVGAAVVACCRNRVTAARLCLGFALVALGSSLLAWLAYATTQHMDKEYLILEVFDQPFLALDGLSAPLLPLVALLHVLTVLATARTKEARFSFSLALVAEALQLAAFACPGSWLLVLLLALGTLPPYLELLRRRCPTRVYAGHMALFVALLVAGWAGQQRGMAWASVALFAAVLVRCGTAPAHLWVGDLFAHASFGSALLFIAPLTGVYAAVRLVLPTAPDWALQGLGMASLLTAVYAAGLAAVAREGRRFFACLLLSQSSLVVVGLELHTAISLTGSLCLWLAVPLALSGLGLTLRALEARCGRLSLTTYRGMYDQAPALAVCFLLAGLASVGFPGTVGFVAADLLVEGAVEANPLVGVGLILASAVNGIAVLRVYFLLFTGTRHQSSAPLEITFRERFAVLVLAAMLLGGALAPQPGVADRHAAAEALLSKRLAVLDPER